MGGFSGNETTLTQRNPTSNLTVLNGNVGTIGINAYHVISNINNDLNASSTLDGFSIIGGEAIGTNLDNAGGGIINVASSPTIEHCIFSGNSASEGGAVFNQNASPSFVHCAFSNNVAFDNGGAICNRDLASPILTNCMINSNEAALGGGMANFNGSNPILQYVNIISNNAIEGGGMCNDNAAPSVINCIFKNNIAGSGAAIFNLTANPTLLNGVFSENSASSSGSVLTNSSSSNATFINCTLQGNLSNNTSAISNDGLSSSSLSNCIVWGNDSGIFDEGEASIVNNSIIEGGFSGNNVWNTDPLFVNASLGNLNLLPCSPATDKGSDALNNTTFDLSGNIRKFDAVSGGSIIDLGAYEYQTSAPSITALCQNVSVVLDNTGEATVLPAMIDNGSNGGCEPLSFTIDMLPNLFFSCNSNPPAQQVVLTVVDAMGNSASCNATVSLVDNTPPMAICITDLSISLDPSGNASISPANIDAGSNDVCGIGNLALSLDNFTCSHVGDNESDTNSYRYTWKQCCMYFQCTRI